MYKLLRPITGEYTVKLSCVDPLPFLRRLTAHRVLFWSLCGGDGVWYLKTTLSCGELLLNNAREAGIPGEIVKTRGLPFFAAKYKKRPGLLLGLFLGLALLFYSELFVWKVTVNGNTTVPDGVILDALEAQGVAVGSYIPAIPVLEVQNRFLLQFHDLSSVAINVKGTHIQVEVLERVHEPPRQDTSGYCNVAATRDGIIVSAKSAAGTVIVSPGEVVEAGQILISAFSVGKRNVYRVHHARGEVLARVYETHSAVFPVEREVKHYTGREKVRRVVSVLGKEFAVSSESPYLRFDTVVEETPVMLLGFIETPVTVTKVTYREYKKETVPFTEAMLKADARLEREQWLASLGEVLAWEETFLFDKIQNAYVLNVSATVLENIGMDLPLEVGEQPPPQVKPPDPIL